jgi:SNF2 family DNA or RNA helicase
VTAPIVNVDQAFASRTCVMALVTAAAPDAENELSIDGALDVVSREQLLKEHARASVASLLTAVRSTKSAFATTEGLAHREELPLPPLLTHGPLALKPHQAFGVQWIWRRWLAGAGGCILADEMGLGKTAQALALCAALYDRHRVTQRMKRIWKQSPHLLQKLCRGPNPPRIPLLTKPPSSLSELDLGIAGPHLIIAPTSLVDNWKLEAARFAPMLKALVLRGSRDERKRAIASLAPKPVRFQLVITSFSMLEDESVAAALRVSDRA